MQLLSATVGAVTTSTAQTIGAFNSSVTPFISLIDDVIHYGRALTVQEIADIHTATLV